MPKPAGGVGPGQRLCFIHALSAHGLCIDAGADGAPARLPPVGSLAPADTAELMFAAQGCAAAAGARDGDDYDGHFESFLTTWLRARLVPAPRVRHAGAFGPAQRGAHLAHPR